MRVRPKTNQRVRGTAETQQETAGTLPHRGEADQIRRKNEECTALEVMLGSLEIQARNFGIWRLGQRNNIRHNHHRAWSVT